MNEKTLKSLEFDKILAEVSHFASSEKGKRDILCMPVFTDYSAVRNVQKETCEAYYAMNNNVYPQFDVDDITDAIVRAQKMSMLTMGELLKIARLLRISKNVRQSISKLDKSNAFNISTAASKIFIQNQLMEDIDRSIFSETEMNDCASSRLASIRSAIKKNAERLRIRLNSYISTPDYQKALQDNVITMRGDRYVIPIKQEFKGAIPGLVHDRSASGATVYVEPMPIVELNNELKILLADEKSEIDKILREFTARVSVISAELIANYEIITSLDVIFARAEYAIVNHHTLPRLNTSGYVNIINGKHPLIERDKVVPVSVSIGEKFNVLLITGPNTGGKTVALKLVGLTVLMAQSGLFIPASEDSDIAVFSNVFCDIGDEQSIEQSLSTFSSHIKNIVGIMNEVDSDSLVLLDELGAGTDPDEGAALAVCITERLRAMGAKSIITTHYGKLKEYSYQANGVENACMDFDPESFEPTYHLIIGVPGTSNALEIASRLGLDKDIVNEARASMGTERVGFDAILLSADQARRAAEQEKEETRLINSEIEQERAALKEERNKLFVLREKLTANAKMEVRRKVNDALDEVNSILAELKKIANEPSASGYFEAAKLRKRIESISDLQENDDDEALVPELTPGVASVGDEVFIKKIGKIGTVMALRKNGDYEVKIGNFTTTIKQSGASKVRK